MNALKWSPTAAQVGTHTINIQVADSAGATVSQEFTLTVNGSNTPPLIQSAPATQGAISSLYRYQVVAIDVEGDRLSYALGQAPTGMVIDPQGLITWTPQADQLGSQTVEVLVSDRQGGTSKQRYELVVGDTPINQVPTITSRPILISNLGSPYQYQVVTLNPENGALTYGLSNAPQGMVIDANTGLITWDQPVLGNHAVVVTAIDLQGNLVSQGYTLTARANQAPAITSTPTTKRRFEKGEGVCK